MSIRILIKKFSSIPQGPPLVSRAWRTH